MSPDHEVADLGLAGLGRAEIELAEQEMAGLMRLRAEYGPAKPLAGARITGLLHMTIQAAVLVETLVELGARVRWAGSSRTSTQDHAAAAIAAAGIPVFAWKDQDPAEFWRCASRALAWPEGEGPTLLLDDGASLTRLIHAGLAYELSGELPAGADPMEQAMLDQIAAERPGFFRDTSAGVIGVSEQTTTGAAHLRRLAESGGLPFPAISVNDSVTKSKFDNRYQCRQSVIDSLRAATGAQIGGKLAVVCGYGDVGKGCADALRAQLARVVVTEVDPICAFQAVMDGYQVVRLEEVITQADIVITATGEPEVVTAELLGQAKHRAVFGNMGHRDDEIDVPGLRAIPVVRHRKPRPHLDEFLLPDGRSVLVIADGRMMNLAVPTEQASFVVGSSLSNQALAQIELHTRNAHYGKGVHRLPRLLDEKVARLHLAAFDARLTTLTDDQAARLGVPVDGPYKPEDYRY